jgi:hypothetical protein
VSDRDGRDLRPYVIRAVPGSWTKADATADAALVTAGSRMPPLCGLPHDVPRDQPEKGTPVTKDAFLTVRWNNLLSLGLGIPTLIYVVIAFSTALWLEWPGLVGLAVFGAFF